MPAGRAPPVCGALCASASGAAGSGSVSGCSGWFVSGSVTVALNRSPSTVMENVPPCSSAKLLAPKYIHKRYAEFKEKEDLMDNNTNRNNPKNDRDNKNQKKNQIIGIVVALVAADWS